MRVLNAYLILIVPDGVDAEERMTDALQKGFQDPATLQAVDVTSVMVSEFPVRDPDPSNDEELREWNLMAERLIDNMRGGQARYLKEV